MTSKFRIGAKIHRINTTKVHRERNSMENVKTILDDDVSSTSSDYSQDWNDFDDDEEGNMMKSYVIYIDTCI